MILFFFFRPEGSQCIVNQDNHMDTQMGCIFRGSSMTQMTSVFKRPAAEYTAAICIEFAKLCTAQIINLDYS